ncbi:hypothetical protein [Klebsiella variicola]|uniref:hypothetical protein n=1 Tax=Klebsiella variicola TaxID=244366 RepID=UPI0022475278|nr:hypothetical protein [Klebsiella variicola]MCW9235236.1 hypothetical protein [Klebsiella variicola]
MSKKKNRKKASPTTSAPTQPETAGVVSFGYDEMLSELEAIVVEAEIRLRDEESLA